MGHSEAVKVLLLRGADRDADRQVRSSCRVNEVHLDHVIVQGVRASESKDVEWRLSC